MQYFYITLCNIYRKKKKKRVGANLKQARKDKGLTQTQVAEKMLMTQQQYSRFENGKFELNYKQIVDLCELFDIGANELFDVR